MGVKIILTTAALAGSLAAPSGARAAKGQLYDRGTILKEFFPEADRVDTETVTITPEIAARLQHDLGYVPVREDGGASYPVLVGKKGDRVLGYAVIDDEKGMHEPITFAVLIGLDGKVERQEVMVYREPEGDGVTAHRFTRQFIGKTVKDPIKDGVDITIVSSATISSHSMAVGVKRAVAIVTEGILARQAPVGRLPGSGT